MKKLAVILLTVLYTISTCGVVWSNFYCCGKLKKVSLFSGNIGTPCMRNAAMHDCCKNNTVFVKVKDVHTSPQQLKAETIKIVCPANTHASIANLSIPVSFSLFIAALHYPPPGTGKQPVYLSNCVFRV